VDILNNITTIYSSISEAARGIGCSETAIRKVLKDIKEKGVYSRPIKKRYLVKPIDSKS